MLRQLLSNNGGGNGGPGYVCGNAEHCPSYPSASTSFESSAFLVTPSSSSTIVPHNQTTEWNEDGKSLATLENMSLANYGTHASTAPDRLGIFHPSDDLNGTTELFSSTFAMLSADSSVSWNAWDEQSGFSNTSSEFTTNEIQMDMNEQSFGFSAHTTAPGCSTGLRYSSNNTGSLGNNYMTDCQPVSIDNRLEMQPQITLNGDAGSRNQSQRKKCVEKLAQMTQSMFSDAYRKIAHIRVPSGFGEADGEGEQVMCMACRGVYSSRRSLTGHIGRNEKCREIIGRNYLDQMSGKVDSMQLSDLGNVNISNGIDPVCPHCDRFISHYKGNIRRHVNQCMKSIRNGSKLRRKDATLKQISSTTTPPYAGCSDIFSDSYQPHVLTTSMSEEVGWMDSSFATDQELGKLKANNVKKDRSNEDPFSCPLCDFATIYKGNMKRHLSTCHGLQDDDLKDGCIDKLKCKDGSVNSRLENVSRGRRPKNIQRNAAQVNVDESVFFHQIDSNVSKAPEKRTDVFPSTFAVVSSTSNCCKESLTNLANDAVAEVGSEMAEIPTDNNDVSTSNTIDETIEAVIANGVESPISKVQSDNDRVAA